MTDSTQDRTDSGTRRSRRTQWAERATIAAAVIAVIALVPSFGSWFEARGDGDGGPSPTPNATATGDPPPTSGTAGPTGTASDWVDLWTVEQVAGTSAMVERPDSLRDRADLTQARFVECTADTRARIVELAWQLNGHYQAFRVSVAAWGKTSDPTQLQVRPTTLTREPDGTDTPAEQRPVAVTANGPGRSLDFRVVGAHKVRLVLECQRARDVLILSDAKVQRA